MVSEIVNKLKIENIAYLSNVSMKKKTWIHRGPVVPLYVQPQTIDELEFVIRLLHESNAIYKVIGHTSNIYMLNSYKVDAIVSTSKLLDYYFDGDTLKCETGVNISMLSKVCVEKGFAGFEGLVGLPGTVGAAIVNNAGCFKCSPSQMLSSATILSFENGRIEKKVVSKDYFEFSHRSSALKLQKKQAVILEVCFQLSKTDDVKTLLKFEEQYVQRRKETQDGKAHNLGSVYSSKKQRPLGIMSLGLRKAPLVLLFRIADHILRTKQFYKYRRNEILLRLYGFNDVIPYMSKKNINCFLWLDEGADAAFIRYQEFMNKCFDCGSLEIEILK